MSKNNRAKRKLRSKKYRPRQSQPNTQPSGSMPLRQLPFYAALDPSPHWYGILPEITVIQGSWIQQHLEQLTLPDEVSPYLKNAINQHHTALIVAGNNRAYFALYSLRAILERVAIGWAVHSSNPLDPVDIILRLSDDSMDVRKRATQDFMEEAHQLDPSFTQLYDMVSQYFAHASKMDGMVLGHESEKDQLLLMRTRVLPLLLLLDAGQRFVTLIEKLLVDQCIDYKPPTGGRSPEFSFNLDWYVRMCAYVMCEKHSPKRGVAIATLHENIGEIEGRVGINTIYRGGMEVSRFGDPNKKPDPSDIASFAWFGIGKGHDDKVKVKCEKIETNGELYRLNWPKSLELDSTGLAFVASHGRGSLEFFDYITAFLKVLEMHEAQKQNEDL